jgi:release factor glutamine methyltransferase
VSAPPRTTNDDWTVRRVLEWTIRHLQERGSDTPRLDAEVLLAHAWGCPRIQLYTRYDEPLPAEVRAAMRELVQRRAAAEPVAYLVGRREFFSLDFEVQPGVFIPRPSTETLVVEALKLMEPWDAPRILDLGTGSGCIAVTLAHTHPGATVTAVDLHPLAVEVARSNAARHDVAGRVTVLLGDLYAPLPPGETFDLVVSNPPYVREDELASLPPDVREHEPLLALSAGADGLDVVRRIAAGLSSRLRAPGGVLIELSPEHASEAQLLLTGTGLFRTVDLVRDLDRVERVLRGVC